MPFTCPRAQRIPAPFSRASTTTFLLALSTTPLPEGLEIVKEVRVRHDGVRRSPWNEVECGHHYARSMSSWAVLLALSGARCDVARGELSFEPVLEASTEEGVFTSFWSCGRGWGTYTQRRDATSGAWQPSVEVLGGDMTGMRVKACGQEWTL